MSKNWHCYPHPSHQHKSPDEMMACGKKAFDEAPKCAKCGDPIYEEIDGLPLDGKHAACVAIERMSGRLLRPDVHSIKNPFHEVPDRLPSNIAKSATNPAAVAQIKQARANTMGKLKPMKTVVRVAMAKSGAPHRHATRVPPEKMVDHLVVRHEWGLRMAQQWMAERPDAAYERHRTDHPAAEEMPVAVPNRLPKAIRDMKIAKAHDGFWQDNPAKDCGGIGHGHPDHCGHNWLKENLGTATAGYRNATADPNEIAKIPGARGEEKRIDQTRVDGIAEHLKQHGFSKIGGPYIEVDHTGKPTISEGNHRTRAAVKLGLKTMPIEVRYFGGSEELPGVWKPGEMKKSRPLDALDPHAQEQRLVQTHGTMTPEKFLQHGGHEAMGGASGYVTHCGQVVGGKGEHYEIAEAAGLDSRSMPGTHAIYHYKGEAGAHLCGQVTPNQAMTIHRFVAGHPGKIEWVHENENHKFFAEGNDRESLLSHLEDSAQKSLAKSEDYVGYGGQKHEHYEGEATDVRDHLRGKHGWDDGDFDRVGGLGKKEDGYADMVHHYHMGEHDGELKRLHIDDKLPSDIRDMKLSFAKSRREYSTCRHCGALIERNEAGGLAGPWGHSEDPHPFHQEMPEPKACAACLGDHSLQDCPHQDALCLDCEHAGRFHHEPNQGCSACLRDHNLRRRAYPLSEPHVFQPGSVHQHWDEAAGKQKVHTHYGHGAFAGIHVHEGLEPVKAETADKVDPVPDELPNDIRDLKLSLVHPVEDALEKAIGADEHLQGVAHSYLGKPVNVASVKHNPGIASKIAQAYGRAPSTGRAGARHAYRQFGREVHAQFAHLQAHGYKMEPWTKPGQPYKNSAEMHADVRQNKHLHYFTGGTKHPLLSAETNNKFRAIHDVFGHAMGGHSFGPNGEESAWREHSQMFSPTARHAMTTETRGQNSFVNYGPKGAANRANPEQTTYAPQKAVLLPKRFAKSEAECTYCAQASSDHDANSLAHVKTIHHGGPGDFVGNVGTHGVHSGLVTPTGDIHYVPGYARHEEMTYRAKMTHPYIALVRRHGWGRLSGSDGGAIAVEFNHGTLARPAAEALKDTAAYHEARGGQVHWSCGNIDDMRRDEGYGTDGASLHEHIDRHLNKSLDKSKGLWLRLTVPGFEGRPISLKRTKRGLAWNKSRTVVRTMCPTCGHDKAHVVMPEGDQCVGCGTCVLKKAFDDCVCTHPFVDHVGSVDGDEERSCLRCECGEYQRKVPDRLPKDIRDIKKSFGDWGDRKYSARERADIEALPHNEAHVNGILDYHKQHVTQADWHAGEAWQRGAHRTVEERTGGEPIDYHGIKIGHAATRQHVAESLGAMSPRVGWGVGAFMADRVHHREMIGDKNDRGIGLGRSVRRARIALRGGGLGSGQSGRKTRALASAAQIPMGPHTDHTPCDHELPIDVHADRVIHYKRVVDHRPTALKSNTHQEHSNAFRVAAARLGKEPYALHFASWMSQRRRQSAKKNHGVRAAMGAEDAAGQPNVLRHTKLWPGSKGEPKLLMNSKATWKSMDESGMTVYRGVGKYPDGRERGIREISDEVADHHGIDREKLWSHRGLEFTRRRADDSKFYTTEDRKVARAYAKIGNEPLDDSLRSAYHFVKRGSPYKNKADYQKFRASYMQAKGIKPHVQIWRVPASHVESSGTFARPYKDVHALRGVGKRMPANTVMLDRPMQREWLKREHAVKSQAILRLPAVQRGSGDASPVSNMDATVTLIKVMPNTAAERRV